MILIVEDDTVLGDLFARGLRGAGHEVRVATTADQGLEQLPVVRPTAIVLDFRMPLINGLRVLYRLRASETHRQTPVVVVTGEAPLAEDFLAQFNELGARVRLKPITPEQLIDALRLALAPSPQRVI